MLVRASFHWLRRLVEWLLSSGWNQGLHLPPSASMNNGVRDLVDPAQPSVPCSCARDL
jgi:hypothetical protein